MMVHAAVRVDPDLDALRSRHGGFMNGCLFVDGDVMAAMRVM